MRYTYILLAVILSCTIAHAQRLSKIDAYTRDNGTNTLKLYSSDVYHYSPNNSSTNPDKIEYYISMNSTAPSLQKYGEDTYTYDANGKLTESATYEGANANSMTLYSRSLFFYNSAGIQDSMIIFVNYNTSYLHYAEKRYLDSKGLVQKVVAAEVYVDSSNIKETYYSYNANGSVVVDSTRYYSTNSPNNVYISAKKLSYNSSGSLALIEEYYYDTDLNLPPDLSQSEYYHYNANDSLMVDSILYNYVGAGVGVPHYKKETYYYRDNNDKPLRVYGKEIDNYNTPNAKVSFERNTYMNANGSIDRIIYYNGYSQGVVDDSIKYHYGAYTPGSGSNSSSNIVAYPIPSGNVLNMQWPANGEVQVSVRIVNSRGQIVKQWTDQANGTYYKTIDVSSLQAGNYYIVLDAGGKHDTKQISIQR